ncbi:unnamed protein product, partial [Acanthoscelides obtectus]
SCRRVQLLSQFDGVVQKKHRAGLLRKELLKDFALIGEYFARSVFDVLQRVVVPVGQNSVQTIGVNERGTKCNKNYAKLKKEVKKVFNVRKSFRFDFESRFEDILTMVIPPWIINPYGDIEETNVIIQEELTELSTNEELKVQFKNGYQQFWLQNNISVTYPVLWNIARKCLISFPSSYLVERGFSAVTNLITKKRNRLDIISRGDLRLTLTKLTPNVDNLLLSIRFILLTYCLCYFIYSLLYVYWCLTNKCPH